MSADTDLVIVKAQDLTRLIEAIDDLRNLVSVNGSGSTEDEILTPKEAAEFIQLSEYTLRDLAAQGRIPHRKAGRRLRFSKRALSEWVQNGAGDVVPLPRRTGSHRGRR